MIDCLLLLNCLMVLLNILKMGSRIHDREARKFITAAALRFKKWRLQLIQMCLLGFLLLTVFFFPLFYCVLNFVCLFFVLFILFVYVSDILCVFFTFCINLFAFLIFVTLYRVLWQIGWSQCCIVDQASLNIKYLCGNTNESVFFI